MCKAYFARMIWRMLKRKLLTQNQSEISENIFTNVLCRIFTKYAFSKTILGSKHFLVTSFQECSSQVVNEAELQGKFSLDLLRSS